MATETVVPTNAEGKEVKTGLAAVRDFFQMKLPEMSAEWTKGPLSDPEKDEIKKSVWAFYQKYPTSGERDKILNDPKAVID